MLFRSSTVHGDVCRVIRCADGYAIGRAVDFAVDERVTESDSAANCVGIRCPVPDCPRTCNRCTADATLPTPRELQRKCPRTGLHARAGSHRGAAPEREPLSTSQQFAWGDRDTQRDIVADDYPVAPQGVAARSRR